PTLKNVRIHSAQDALQVFNAVAMHRLPLITRRLNVEERSAIIREMYMSGEYAMEEHGPTTEITGLGIEHWTDGIRWGPSRIQSSTRPTSEGHSSINLRQLPEYVPLLKQTYNVFVFLPADCGIKHKWHLTVYFSLTKVDELDTIDNIPGVGDVIVPDRWFESAHREKVR
ncbi:hypothetical protein BDQ17DRAFT_1181306, partial [Cyathus striatus]